MKNTPTIRAYQSDFRFGISLVVVEERDGKHWTAKPPEMEPYTDGEVIDPTVVIDTAAAQQLMDDLWLAGVRPTEAGSTGEIKAMNQHLQDMRTIAFSRLEVDKPG